MIVCQGNEVHITAATKVPKCSVNDDGNYDVVHTRYLKVQGPFDFEVSKV